MIRFIWVGLLCLFLGGTGGIAAPRELVVHRDYSVHFSEQAIHLDTPIVSLKGVYFVPVREILPHLEGKMRRRVRQNDFVLSFDHFPQTISFSRHSDRYFVGDVEKRFSTPPFLFETRDYLPFEDFLRLIGYSVVRKGNAFYVVRDRVEKKAPVKKVVARPKISPPKPTPLPSPKVSKISKVLKKDRALFHLSGAFESVQSVIPSAFPNGPLYLSVNGKKTRIDGGHFVHEGVLYVDFRPVFDGLGYETRVSGETGVVIRNKGVSYSFVAGVKEMIVTREGKDSRQATSYFVVIKTGKVYFPLRDFSKDLGVVPRWVGAEKTLYLLSVITELGLYGTDSGYEFRVSSSGPFSTSKQTKILSPPRVYWDFRGTIPAFSDRYFEVDVPEFGYFGLARHPSFTRVALSVNQQVSSRFSGTTEGGVLSILTRKEAPKTPVISAPPPPSKPAHSVQISKPVSSKALHGRVIAIDPGHGGFDPGAVVKGAPHEKVYTLDISKRLSALLKAHGAKVLMARHGDENPTLGARTRLANRNGADLIISVHVNSFVESYARGTETYYYKQKDYKVAKLIHQSMVNTLGLRDNGVKKSRMFILNHSTMPGVLVEPCFMTNPNELKLLKTEAFRQKIAGAIFEGILQYFR